MLPWYFRSSTVVISLLSVGPFALPLVLMHPKLSIAWKSIITVATLALSWMAYQVTMDALKMFNDTMKEFQGGGFL
jgi:hypothetical protein